MPADLPPAVRAELDALRAQRNREADAVASLNGLLAEANAEIRRLSDEVARLRADVARLEQPAEGGA